MSRCAGIRADGGRCGAQAIRDSEWCFNHHPDYEEARRRRASRGGKRGGRGRPNADIAALKGRISEVVNSVLDGSMDRGRAAVAIQGLSALRGVLELERRIRETEELADRVAELEAALEAVQ